MSDLAPPAAAAPAAPASTPAPSQAAPAPVSDWTSGFNDEIKGYVQTKGFKDPSAVVDSYRNMEKLMGAPKERLLRLPEKEDDPAWGEVYDRLGRPKEAKDYNITVDPKYGDPKFTDWSKETFHKLGIPKAQGEKLAKGFDEFMMARVKAQETQRAEALKVEDSKLQSEWGAAYNQNIEVAKNAVQALGLDAETIDKLEQSMGFAQTMKFIHNLGTKVGEGEYVGGNRSANFSGAMTPQQATNEIQNLRGDPEFVRRYTNGDNEARQKMERLHKMAYPDQN